MEMERMSRDKILAKRNICQMFDLPQPSVSLINIIHLLHEREVDLRKVADAVGQDQALVAKILREINSSYHCLTSRIDDVESAVNLLGVINLKGLVYSAVCFEFFGLNEHQEWNHAHSSSLLVSELMKNNYISVNGNAQLTALLHDIGKVIFRRKAPKRYQEAVDLSERSGRPIEQVETEFFGFDHAAAGSWLLGAWGLPEDIVFPIAHHHDGSSPMAFREETDVLRLVNWVDRAARGVEFDPPSFGILKSASDFDTERRFLVNSQRDLIQYLGDAPKFEAESTPAH